MQPPAGTRVSDGSKVTLFWSDGPEQVPDVEGKTEAEATAAHPGRRLPGRARSTDSSTPSEQGTVLQQSPGAGTTLDEGSTVTIVVSNYTSPDTLAAPHDNADRPTAAPSRGLDSARPGAVRTALPGGGVAQRRRGPSYPGSWASAVGRDLVAEACRPAT